LPNARVTQAAQGTGAMNEQLVPVVEPKHHDLKETAGRVEPETQLASRNVLVQVSGEDRMPCGVDGISRIDPMLARGIRDLHAT
jgi:hypothetical protein